MHASYPSLCAHGCACPQGCNKGKNAIFWSTHPYLSELLLQGSPGQNKLLFLPAPRSCFSKNVKYSTYQKSVYVMVA